MQINFDTSQKCNFRRDRGHYKIYATVFRDAEKAKVGLIDFIYDSGAFLTVINKERYESLGLNSLPRHEHYISGYAGKTEGYYFQIPWLRVGGEDVPYVWAFSPKSGEYNQNLLGTNVIERFRVFQDNQEDCFYFSANLNPRFYATEDGHSFAGGLPFNADVVNSLFASTSA